MRVLTCRCGAAALAAAVTAVAAGASAGTTVPRPTGQYAVATRSVALTDPSRREPHTNGRLPRSIVAQFWYPTSRAGRPRALYMPRRLVEFFAANGLPAASTAGIRLSAEANGPPLGHPGGWPVVLFSPGYGTERQLYTGLVEDLASHGYVVIAIDHPHDANLVVFPDGHAVARGPIRDSQKTVLAALDVRIADVRFLLDRLPSLHLAGRLDLNEIGMFGHSLWGATAAAVMMADSRIRAGADLDGWIFGPVRARGLDKPFLIFTGRRGYAHEPKVARFWHHLRGPRYAVDFLGAEHFAFSDLVFLLPALRPRTPALEQAQKQVLGNAGASSLGVERKYVRAFFDQFLRGERSPLLRRPNSDAHLHLTVGAG